MFNLLLEIAKIHCNNLAHQRELRPAKTNLIPIRDALHFMGK
jgi:hypothetical protein